MANIRKGKLTRRDKKITLRDERELRKEANEVLRQTRKDMFNPARITIRHIDQHQHEIDRQLETLERLRGHVREGHKEYHDLNAKKTELQSWKKRLRMARKAKKLGAKNTQISKAVKEGEKKKTHNPLKLLIGRSRNRSGQ